MGDSREKEYLRLLDLSYSLHNCSSGKKKDLTVFCFLVLWYRTVRGLFWPPSGYCVKTLYLLTKIYSEYLSYSPYLTTSDTLFADSRFKQIENTARDTLLKDSWKTIFINFFQAWKILIKRCVMWMWPQPLKKVTA
jgi:hypothetical protein